MALYLPQSVSKSDPDSLLHIALLPCHPWNGQEHWAAQYDIHQIPISGVSPDQEPSAQTLAKISDLIKKENIKIVFFESLVSPKLSQTMASETGAKTMVLDPIEGISDNGLRSGENYLTVMKSNLTALQTALECN